MNNIKRKKSSKKKNKQGFTLIELLAVIIILGVLLLIAVPSISKYIDNSRKNTYVNSIKSIVNAVSTSVNALELPYTMGKGEGIIIPFLEANLEKTSSKTRSPYAKYVPEKSFILVMYDGERYIYYISALDEAGYGIPLVNEKLLSTDSITTDKSLLNENVISYSDVKTNTSKIFDTDALTIKYMNNSGSIVKVKICSVPYTKGDIIKLKNGTLWYAIQDSGSDYDTINLVSYNHMNTSGLLGEQSTSKTTPTIRFHSNQQITGYSTSDIYSTAESIVTNTQVKLTESKKINLTGATIRMARVSDFCTPGSSSCYRLSNFTYLNDDGKFWTSENDGKWVYTISKEGVGSATADNSYGIRVVISGLQKSNIDKQGTKELNK